MRSSLSITVLTGLNAACAALAHAAVPATAATRPFAAPDTSGVATGGAAGHMLQTLLALIVVLGLVFALAWFFRRLRQSAGGSAAAIEIISQASLGTRERAVLLRVGEARVLVGVAAGSVRTLHVLTAAESASLGSSSASTSAGAPATGTPGFAELLRRSLGVK